MSLKFLEQIGKNYFSFIPFVSHLNFINTTEVYTLYKKRLVTYVEVEHKVWFISSFRLMLEQLLHTLEEKYGTTHSTVIYDPFSQSRKLKCQHTSVLDVSIQLKRGAKV